MDSRYLLYWCLLFVGAVFGIFVYKRLNAQYRVLALYFVLICFSEFMTRVVGYIYQNAMLVYHYLVPIQMLAYSLFYYYFFVHRPGAKKIFLFIGVILILLSILNSIFLQSVLIMPTNAILLHSLFSISLALFSFRYLIQFPTELKLLQAPIFWFNVGSMGFYGVLFFFLGYYNVYGIEIEGSEQFIWYPNMFMYSCYFYALYLASKSKIAP